MESDECFSIEYLVSSNEYPVAALIGGIPITYYHITILFISYLPIPCILTS